MEKRIGAAIVLIENKNAVDELNAILSMHSSIILADKVYRYATRNQRD
jgi:hypothetical protein